MAVLKILLGCAFCLWILLLWRRRKYYMFMLKVPGPIGLPLVGVLYKVKCLEVLVICDSAMEKRRCIRGCSEGGPHFTFPNGNNLESLERSPIFSWVGPIPVFATWDPQTAQDILTSPHCINRAHLYGPMCEVLGNGLLTLANPEWHLHRKLLNPAFSNENLRSFLPIFNEKTKAFVKDFEISYDGASINILPMMQKLTIYTSLQTTMGLKRDPNRHTNDDNKEERLFNFYRYFADKVIAMVIMPWLRFDFVRKFVPSFKTYSRSKIELQKLFENEICEKLKLFSTTDTINIKYAESAGDGLEKKKVQIFFDLAIDLMRSGKFTAKNVEDHANNLVFGAFENTATTITHALMLLAMNPQYQETAFEEIFMLYTDRDNVTVNEEDLQHLVYLDMVINETMRLIPTVPFIGRSTTADVRLSSGVVIPSGTQILINIFDIHRHKNIWGPNALVFNPENTLPENMRNKHPYAFIPFTKGIRSCIGWRYGLNATKIVLTILLRKYRFTTTSKFEDLRYSPAITSRLIDPPLLQLHLREK